MPNITFATQDEIPDGLKEFAKKVDDKFVVEVVPGAKLEEFRTNNIRISQERDALGQVVQKLKPVVGDDLDGFISGYNELVTTSQKVKDGSLKATDDINKEVENRVATMRSGYDTQLAQAQREKAEALAAKRDSDNKYNRSIVDRAVTTVVIDPNSGANPEALNHILKTAYEVFQVTADGKLIAKDGDAVIYGANGADPMTPAEWLARLRTQAPYFFKSSNGGGAAGGNNTGNERFGGMTKADFDKLSPDRKLAIAHQVKAQAKR